MQKTTFFALKRSLSIVALVTISWVQAYDDLPINDIPRPGGVEEVGQIVDQAIAQHRARMEQWRLEFDSWREQRKAQFSSSFLAGHRSRLISNGPTLFRERMNAIKSATKSIYLATFIFDADITSRKIVGALCQKGKEGLDVRLLVDSFGGKPFFNANHDAWLRNECGVKVVRYNPPSWAINKIAFVMHEKLLIIDGKLILMGGNGIQNAYHHVEPAHKFFHDMDIRIEGPVACYFQRELNKSYQESIKWSRRFDFDGNQPSRRVQERMWGLSPFETCSLNQEAVGTERFQGVYANPLFSKDKPIFESYLNAILSLEDGDEIRLYAPYFVPHERFTAALLWARSRGMKVTILTNSIESNDEGVAPVVGTVLSVGKLLDAGVKIQLWKGPMTLHRKSGVYGTKYAYVGSDNLDSRGHFYSSESIAFTDEARTVRQMIQHFDYDLENSFTLTKDYFPQVFEAAGRLQTWAIRNILLKYL